MSIFDIDKINPKTVLSIYDSANWLYDDPRWKGSEDIFEALSQTSKFLTAQDEEEIAGFLSYCALDDCIIITGLYVPQEHQRKGIASALLEGLLLAHPNRPVFAEVINTALWAKKFYEKHGFCELPKSRALPENAKAHINHNPWSCVYKIQRAS
ncbi:MAG: GNAT family N-acetyltransferase [Defluviitaleaceae bacterium]|nr:GNAT family N-acetyltransferase [Defluviitaleaceae bacterium]